MSNAACLIQASFVLCVFRRVKDHHSLLNHSPLLKKNCVRQVVSDKWFPLSAAERGPERLVARHQAGEARGRRGA